MLSPSSIELQGPALSDVPESPSRLPLHQLPPPPGDFTGRRDTLEALVEKVRFDGQSIIGLFGMGGVGKTALGLSLAEELVPRYADAQIYLDLKGTTGEPLPPLDAMAHVIRAFDPAYPETPLELDIDGHYRSVLNGRRVIIFLDDVAHREQVIRLIPPAESLLIVTSRNRFTLPGLLAKDVDPLSAEDAAELALRVVPKLDGRAADMAALCGCLPGALRRAADLLGEYRDLTVENCMLRLSQSHEKRALVDGSVSPGYRALSPELQRLWRLLAVFPGRFDSADAGAIWGISEGAAQDLLSVLLSCSMLQWHESPPAYGLHDLVRLWALAQSPEEERLSIQQKLAEYGATILAGASEMYLQGGESLRRGLDLFDAERPNIEAGWAWASAHAEQDELAERLCVRYPVVAGDLLDVRQTPRERIQWLQAPLAAARRLKDRHAETSLLGGAGTAYCRMGETQRAIEYHMLALTVARETGEKKLEERALRGLGLAYARSGEFPHALEYHEKSVALAREINDRRGECDCMRELAGDYHAMGVSARAIDLCEEALAIARETGDRCSEGNCLGDIAAAWQGMKEPSRSVNFGSQALVIAREVGDSLSEGSILSTLGRSYEDLGDTRRAIECHEAHLRMTREANDRYGEGNALGNLGNALARSGHVRRALECYQGLLNLVRELGDRRGEAMVLGRIGKARARLGETRVAIECHSEQLQIAREIGDRRTEASALWSTSLVLDKLGDRVQAITHAEAARKIFEDDGDADGARVKKQLAEWTEGRRRSN